nr:MAG TPA: Stress-induced transcription factor NAC1 family, Stress-responsive, DNA BINDING.6A [Caudoviricetes sp.]DAQ99394.1 MAG TPA: Stress-induced transcription factor NAC1 family, Stress-responsive, DNA BINDING.6A [Caudoviricetes sp.]
MGLQTYALCRIYRKNRGKLFQKTFVYKHKGKAHFYNNKIFL